jgi:hypothetical protein
LKSSHTLANSVNLSQKGKSTVRRLTADTGLFTDEDFSRTCPFETVWDELCSGGFIARGLPDSTEYTPEITELFRKLLLTGSLDHGDYDMDIIYHCNRRGWLYAEAIPGPGSSFRYSFSSPLHASCISWKITPTNKPPEFPSVLDLSIAAIKKFKRSQLFFPIRRIGPSPAPLHVVSPAPPEAQYPDEFYRALIAVNKGNTPISPEFASAQGAKVVGRIDFMIPSVRWGIEIIRDGDRLREHNSRFQEGGAYHPWVQAGDMADYILLDFRRSTPRKAHPSMLCIFRSFSISPGVRHRKTLSRRL